jgi:hypothetical protein
LAIHHASEHEGVRVRIEIVQQGIGLGDCGKPDQLLWGTEQRLPVLNQSVAYDPLVHVPPANIHFYIIVSK